MSAATPRLSADDWVRLRSVRARPVADLTAEERELCVRAIAQDVARYQAIPAAKSETIHVWGAPESEWLDPTSGLCTDPGAESLEVVFHVNASAAGEACWSCPDCGLVAAVGPLLVSASS